MSYKKEYWDNGNLKYEGEYKNNGWNDEYHGKGIEYYYDGTLKYEGEWKYGVFQNKQVK